MNQDRNPHESQPAAAFLAALKQSAREPGPLPTYIPERFRAWLLRAKSRHQFSGK